MTHKTQISEADLDRYSQLVDEATQAYFAWVKQILTLSVGSLTVLIALRNQIAPGYPKATILLQTSWFLFALSIVLALFALRGQHDLLFHTARDFFQQASGSKNSGAGQTLMKKEYLVLGRVVPWTFVAAIVALTLFGIVNLTPETKTKHDSQKNQATTLEHPKNTQNEHHHK